MDKINFDEISNKDLTELNKKYENAVFLHFKGEKYRLLYFARNSETQEIVVVYKNIGDCNTYGNILVRPASNFFQKLEDGVPRFFYCEKELC